MRFRDRILVFVVTMLFSQLLFSGILDWFKGEPRRYKTLGGLCEILEGRASGWSDPLSIPLTISVIALEPDRDTYERLRRSLLALNTLEYFEFRNFQLLLHERGWSEDLIAQLHGLNITEMTITHEEDGFRPRDLAALERMLVTLPRLYELTIDLNLFATAEASGAGGDDVGDVNSPELAEFLGSLGDLNHVTHLNITLPHVRDVDGVASLNIENFRILLQAIVRMPALRSLRLDFGTWLGREIRVGGFETQPEYALIAQYYALMLEYLPSAANLRELRWNQIYHHADGQGTSAYPVLLSRFLPEGIRVLGRIAGGAEDAVVPLRDLAYNRFTVVQRALYHVYQDRHGVDWPGAPAALEINSDLVARYLVSYRRLSHLLLEIITAPGSDSNLTPLMQAYRILHAAFNVVLERIDAEAAVRAPAPEVNIDPPSILHGHFPGTELRFRDVAAMRARAAAANSFGGSF